jgi:hypothetical protein
MDLNWLLILLMIDSLIICKALEVWFHSGKDGKGESV